MNEQKMISRCVCLVILLYKENVRLKFLDKQYFSDKSSRKEIFSRIFRIKNMNDVYRTSITD